MKKIAISLATAVAIVSFSGCSNPINNNSLKSIVQTNAASEIVLYKENILNHLIEYKKKLDLRNPKAYNKTINHDLIKQIENSDDNINIIQNGQKIVHYSDYLNYAFSHDDIRNRNDFLILGIYKLIYQAYKMDEKHKFTAISYDKEALVKLYKYLQVISWKVRNLRDNNGEYLFLTWQKNWQIEFAKKYNGDYNIIKDFELIKRKKESVLDQNNFNFEVLIEKMLLNVEYTLRKVNIEPQKIGIEVAKTFLFL